MIWVLVFLVMLSTVLSLAWALVNKKREIEELTESLAIQVNISNTAMDSARDAGLEVLALKEQIEQLEADNDSFHNGWQSEQKWREELQQKLWSIQADPEQAPEQGNFVRTRKIKRATPETYRNVFDLDMNGQRILEHLTLVFCKDAFAPDDKGGERETCYRLGSQSVINFIVNNINQANSPNYKETEND